MSSFPSNPFSNPPVAFHVNPSEESFPGEVKARTGQDPTIPICEEKRQAVDSFCVHGNPTSSTLSSTLTLVELNDPEKGAPEKPGVQEEVPDGGYGWVIVGACTAITFFTVGIAYSWGVLQAALVREQLGSDSTLGFVGSMAIAMVSLGAILNARLIRWFGARNSAVLASCLLGLSQLLCGWVTKSIPGLFICNSLIGGLGISIFFMACGTLPAQYFRRKRGLTSGIIFAGGGMGAGVLSIVMGTLINRVGIPWTFRITGLLSVTFTLPASFLLKDRLPRDQTSLDWSLLRDPKSILLFIGSGIATFSLLVPPFLIPTYAETLGISVTLGFILLAVFNIASALGRIGFGLLCDIVGPVTSLFLALLVNSLSLLAIWLVADSMKVLIVFLVFNGIGGGGFFWLCP